MVSAQINEAIEKIVNQAEHDGKTHDLTIGLGDGGTVFIVHCNGHPVFLGGATTLRRHCERRKYTDKAKRWLGICVRPYDMSLRFRLCLEYPWKEEPAMDEVTKGLARSVAIADAMSALGRKNKVGRNQPCPCGSGRKYKKRCLR